METPYKKKLIEQLKKKDITESSINAYIRNIEMLNEDKPLKNLTFLNDIDHIKELIGKYSKNTQRNKIISVCTVLSSFDKPPKIYKQYFDLLKEYNTTLKEEESKNIKTEKQEKNWITLEEIENIKEDLKSKVDKFKNKKQIDESQYNTLLSYLVLSLYTDISPRRNKDFQDMYIVNDTTKMQDDKNYLFMNKKNMEFLFNTYKTAKTHGPQVLQIPDKLRSVIKIYLGKYPEKNYLDKKFLVKFNGSPLPVNGITFILNKIFGKNISSSMIRHIFLSEKFGDVKEEMKKVAEEMSHSLAQQSEYVKH